MAEWRLDALRAKLEDKTDTENDTHLTTDEKSEYIAAAVEEAWDEIVSSGMSDRYVKSATFSAVAGTLEYDLTSASIVSAQDFYKIHQLYVDEGSGHMRPLRRINPAEVHTFRPPMAGASMKLYYIKTPPTFKTAGSFVDSATVELPPNGAEFVVELAAIKVRNKKQEDARPHSKEAERYRTLIKQMGNTDWSQPQRVVRRRKTVPTDWSLPYLNNVSVYAVRGQKLELYYAYPWVP